VGTVLIVGGDFHGGSLLGDGLAVIGGVAAAAYTLAGREARRDLGIFEYAAVTYGIAALCLLVLCVFSGESLGGYDPTTWWAIVGLIVGPQLFGHTIINLVLKELDATVVSVTIMAEPVIATFSAFVLFSEVPVALFYPGAVAVLMGIGLVALATRVPPEVFE
jgi:drug/metabolite transporter (DMT)-like permease